MRRPESYAHEIPAAHSPDPTTQLSYLQGDWVGGVGGEPLALSQKPHGPMNLRGVDLNLLVAFDALMRTRHVTRAGQLLGIGQPGMSATLTRLRTLFSDALLIKQGGEMVPTARALELEPQVRSILRQVERVVEDEQRFDPATTTRTFRLRLSDLLLFLFMPGLMARAEKEAPGLKLEALHLSPDATVDAIECNDIELAISTRLDIPKSIAAEPLFRDRLVCVSRPGHPAGERLAEAGAFAALPQIRVSQGPLDDRFVDRQLAMAGLERNVALSVPHWLTVPTIVTHTDLIAVMPASIAHRLVPAHGLAQHAVPLGGDPFEWALYWHRRHTGDPGHRWLRDAVRAEAPAVDEPRSGEAS